MTVETIMKFEKWIEFGVIYLRHTIVAGEAKLIAGNARK